MRSRFVFLLCLFCLVVPMLAPHEHPGGRTAGPCDQVLSMTTLGGYRANFWNVRFHSAMAWDWCIKW